MRTKRLTEILARIEAWPPETQNQLADFALELDAGLSDDIYEPTPEELAGIERGCVPQRKAALPRTSRSRQCSQNSAVNEGRLH